MKFIPTSIASQLDYLIRSRTFSKSKWPRLRFWAWKQRMITNSRQRFIQTIANNSLELKLLWKSVHRLMRRASFFETSFYYSKYDFLQFLVVLSIGYLICILLLYLTYMVSCSLNSERWSDWLRPSFNYWGVFAKAIYWYLLNFKKYQYIAFGHFINHSGNNEVGNGTIYQLYQADFWSTFDFGTHPFFQRFYENHLQRKSTCWLS